MCIWKLVVKAAPAVRPQTQDDLILYFLLCYFTVPHLSVNLFYSIFILQYLIYILFTVSEYHHFFPVYIECNNFYTFIISFGLGPNLQVVSTMSVGYEHIDLQACRDKGIAVTNTPNVSSDSVSELTVSLVLLTARRLLEGTELSEVPN